METHKWRTGGIDIPVALSVLHNGGLANGVKAFSDRADQKWADLPTVLLGADYIESAQDKADRTDDDITPGPETLALEVDVLAGTVLHMFIDTRPPTGSLVPFSWMTLANFGSDWIDSGEFVRGVDLDASGSGDGPRNARVFRWPLS